MKLSDARVRNVKAGEKPIKLSDGGGLFLLVQPNGAKGWRLAYRFEGKQKLLSLGVYEKDEMTGHGFRSIASTTLHELGWPSAVIERQLAHGERNKVKAAYNFAEHLAERRKMMQTWADYLDKLKSASKAEL